MNSLKAAEEIKASFSISRMDLRKIRVRFQDQIHSTLMGKPASLKSLPSFLSPATGQERGEFLAVDFGGSNLRVSLVSLLGEGRHMIRKEISRPLKDPALTYDYTTAATSGPELFNFAASLVYEVYAALPVQSLGLTFSYPMEQKNVNNAYLLRWTKEMKPRDTIGKSIYEMFTAALARQGLEKLMLKAIINDTVACFLAASYQCPHVVAGSICGTGHNTCYRERSLRTSDNLPMIVNLEAGNFSDVPVNYYDQQLDSHSDDPGQQQLEKMVSGKYLGELMRLVLLDLINRGIISAPADDCLTRPYALGSEILGWLQSGQPGLNIVPGHNSGQLLPWLSQLDYSLLRTISTAIVSRASQLMASTFLAIMDQVRYLLNPTIAVDGSVFLYMPGMISAIESFIRSESAADHPQLFMTANGSSIGAAVAAASVRNEIF